MMDIAILRGYSIQDIAGSTVIFDNVGQRWHDFGRQVDQETAQDVIAAFKAGHAAGRTEMDEAAAMAFETLKNIASRAHAAIAKS
jgi:hypothetical protein